MKEKIDRRAITALSVGHLMTDMSQVVLPALLPFLIEERGLSYAASGGLVLAGTISSSIVQPFFGHFSDRKSFSAMIPLGVFLSGAGIALIGVSSSYLMTLLFVIISGLGVAAFHPEAARFANYVSGSRRATGMSFFSVGGNAGFGVGPVLATPIVIAFGLPGTLLLLIPSAIIAVILLLELPHLHSFKPNWGDQRVVDDSSLSSPDRSMWGPFATLSGVIAVRSLVHFGLITFVPLFLVGVAGASKPLANGALSAMLFAGAASTLVGGQLADRIGRRAVLLVSMLVLPPLIFGFAFSGTFMGIVLLLFIGAAAIASFSVTVVMGQEYLPDRIGVASGVTVGLAIGIGGLGAPLLGAIADNFGLSTTMITLAILPLPGILLSLFLPK